MCPGVFQSFFIYRADHYTDHALPEVKMEEKYMRRAIELALKGTGYTDPNPRVGAVIVKDGRIIGEGYHERYGELHAERNALAHCTDDPHGSTVYVTLEPCCHHGKQPPCTDALIEAGVTEVIVGSPDPNPLVAGKGIEILRAAGISVTTDYLRSECDAINRKFFYYITKGLPYITMKYAMTLDGKIASVSGRSRWISCPESREYVHHMRAENMAIMAGVGTVLADDPMLNVRSAEGLDPVRVICDTDLRTPLSSKVVTTASGKDGNYRDWLPRTIIATCCSDAGKISEYEDKGVMILDVAEKDGKISICDLMHKLGDMKIDSLLVEGGAELNWSVLESGLANHAYCFIAPKILGGRTAKTPVSGTGCDSPDTAFQLVHGTVRAVGTDIAVEGDLIR